MKKILISVVLISMALLVFTFLNKFEVEPEKVITNTKADVEERNGNVSVDVFIDSVISKMNLNERLHDFAQVLLPLSSQQMAVSWEEEYGCYIHGAESMKEELMSNECEYSLLTASSLEEAKWMQRQGYPNKTQLRLLNDQLNIKDLNELAVRNFKPAITLMALNTLENGYNKDAVSWALKLAAYSDKSQTFPHRIHAEALIASELRELGVIDLKVAALLGDTDAQYLFNRYTANDSGLAMIATDNAHLRMARYFNVPYNQYPVDQRPIDGG